ncbi:MAG: hypothetical protein WC871_03595 [Bacteroidales bacterium]|jgi:hypothetical protein
MSTVHVGFEKDLKFTLSHNGRALVCRHAPVNWDEAFITWERSERYHGLFRSYSQKLKFVKDGAYFLRRCFYAENRRTRAECTLKVEKIDRMTLDWEEVFTGDCDFSTFTDQRDFVTITVNEGGLVKYLKLYEDTEYDVSLSATFNYTDPVAGVFVCKYNSYYDILYYILEKMTGNRISSTEYLMDLGFIADYVNTRGLTTGRGIRTPSDYTGTYTFKMSFARLMTDLMRQNCAGVTIAKVGGKDCLKVDYLYNIYDSTTEVYDLGEVRDLIISVQEKLLFNQIEVGSDDPSYRNASTYHEFCCKSIFHTPQLMSNDKLDLTCNIRTDFTGVLDVMLTPDDGADDEEIYHVALYYDGSYYRPLQGWVKKLTEVPWQKAYNVPYSPARCLARWQRYIDGCHDGFAGEEITLEASGLDNMNNETDGGGLPGSDTVLEDYPYVIAGDKLFLPYLFKFEAPAGYEFLKAMQANQLGYVKFTYLGNDFTGFLQEGNVTLAAKGIIDFTLLACPGNNLTKLIRV